VGVVTAREDLAAIEEFELENDVRTNGHLFATTNNRGDSPQLSPNDDAADEAVPVPGAFLRNEEQERSSFLPPTVRNAEHLFLDVAALLAGDLPDPPKPRVGKRDDGHAVFYAGQVNFLFGDPESGKTLLCQAAQAEALADGRRVLSLDLDHNGPEATVSRLLMLGAPWDALRDRNRFRYVEPEDETHLRAIMAAALEWRPAVAGVDSIGELLPTLRLSSNSPDDFTIAHAQVLKPLARAGACVIAIDHLAKNNESRAAGPTGTAAKRRAVGGVSLRVVLKDPFTPGRGGSAALTVHKDRHGGLRRVCPTPKGGEAYAGTFIIRESGGVTTWRITAPRDDDRAPDQATALDLAALSHLDPPPDSVRDVKERLKWGTDRATKALHEWRSAFPTHADRNAEHACAVCGEPMTVVETGQTTHPDCDPEGTAA
jgi:hypothetical protein